MLESEPPKAKQCHACGHVKPASEFWKRKQSPDGLALYCRKCFGVRHAASKRGQARQTGKEMRPVSSPSGSPAKHVGHSHAYGNVRAILCFSCNGGLGQYEDEPRRLRQAALYLELRGPHADRMALDMGRRTIPRRDQDGRGSRSIVPMSRSEYKLRAKYGITAKDKEALRGLQVGLCAICADLPARDVGHDHATGGVRGLLCSGCNSGMGQFGDDPVSLRRRRTTWRGR